VGLTLEKNLEFYIKKYKLIDEKDCKEIVSEIENLNWQQHTFYSPSIKKISEKSGEKEFDCVYAEISTKELIMKKIWDAYFNYIKDLNFRWFDGWTGYSDVRFNRYTENKIMAEHWDYISGIFDGQRKGVPIMSALGSLNDDYNGGELIFFGDKVIPLKTGEIMIFPSNFLYPHKVNPVKKGIRYSFVSWSW